MRSIALLFLLAAGAAAADVKEAEPNDEPNAKLQEVRPGDTIAGSFATVKDKDHYVLVAAQSAVVTARFTYDKAVRINAFRIAGVMRQQRSSPPHATGFETRRLRVKKGRHVITIESWKRGKPGAYRLELVVEEDKPVLETEPNDHPAGRLAIAPGTPFRGEKSHPFGDVDRFGLAVKERGIYRLTFVREEVPEVKGPASERGRVRFALSIGKKYRYEVDHHDTEFRFFPVLDPGTHFLTVKMRGGVTGGSYAMLCERVKVGVTPETENAARAAIDRGLAWLLAAPPPRSNKKYRVSMQATALLALGEGSGLADRKEERARKVGELVADLEAKLAPAPGGEWDGKPVDAFGGSVYDNAFAVLALAEAAAGGSKHAREVCKRALPFLLASQIGPKRCKAWNPVPAKSAQTGGWRYTANAKQGDISVTGWCLIALYAAANAGIEAPGLVEAADASLRFLRHVSSLDGFRYQPQTGGKPSSVRQSIGALLSAIFGMGGPPLKRALDDIDQHFCAGTQTGHGDNAPFYYWYYATRLNFLRGGYAWEAWRTVALEQLLRRQREDGSWHGIHHETQGGDIYATGMGVLLLRLCLNEPPHYLSRDVEGF